MTAVHPSKTQGSKTARAAKSPAQRRSARKSAEALPGRQLKDTRVTSTPMERAARAFVLRTTTDLSWAAIARKVGYASGGGAYHAAMRHALRVYPPSPEEQDVERERMLARLADLWSVVYPRALAGDPTATRQCLAIAQRRLRLMGVDMRSPLAQTIMGTWRLAAILTPAPENEPEPEPGPSATTTPMLMEGIH